MAIDLYFAVLAPLEEQVSQEQQERPKEDEWKEDTDEIRGSQGHCGPILQCEFCCEAHVVPSAIQSQLWGGAILQIHHCSIPWTLSAMCAGSPNTSVHLQTRQAIPLC